MDYGYELLRAAILKQAIFDYQKALRKRWGRSIHSLEEFFLSDWGQFLSADNGEAIIRKCRECCDMKRIKRFVK